MADFIRTARGLARIATPEEIAKEESNYFLASDTYFTLLTDTGEALIPNVGDLGYTHPNLHRRVETDPDIPQGSNYPFIAYDANGNGFVSKVTFGVWDGIHSYRTTDYNTHDEESTTCEIP